MNKKYIVGYIICVFCFFLLVQPGCELIGSSRHITEDQKSTFEEALKSFETAQSPEDYLVSANLYESLIHQGLDCGAVYYNQGNAYAQANVKGRALAAYRNAQKYMPSNASLASDILSVGGSNNPPSWLETTLFWQNWISYPSKAYLLLVLSFITVLVGLIPWFWYRKEWVICTSVLLFLTVTAGVSFSYDYYRYDYQRHGVVVVEEVVARKGDANTYAEAFDSPLKEGVEFTVVQQRDKWLKVRIDNNLEGWIPIDSTSL